jgi:hypothetical protein
MSSRGTTVRSVGGHVDQTDRRGTVELASPVQSSTAAASEMKARQCGAIKELHDVLLAAGFESLDDQARELGICRSTMWTITKARHKSSGLSPTIINRILAQPKLESRVRKSLVQYVRDKSAGLYGHSKIQLRRFSRSVSAVAFAESRIAMKSPDSVQTEKASVRTAGVKNAVRSNVLVIAYSLSKT